MCDGTLGSDMRNISPVSSGHEATINDECNSSQSNFPTTTVPRRIRSNLVSFDKLPLITIVLILVLFSGYEVFSRNNAIWNEVADSWGFTLGPWIAIFGVLFLVGVWLVKENYRRTDSWSWGVKSLGRMDLHNGIAPLIEEDYEERSKYAIVGMKVLDAI